MSSTTKLLREYIKEIVKESASAHKRLRIFDFDDTLVKTDSAIHVTSADGTKFDLSPGEFAVYDQLPGDVFDYADFEKLINPREIKWVCKILHNVYSKHGPEGIVILTARGSAEPVHQFLDDIGLPDIEVSALGDANPHMKALWIDSRIKRDDLDMVEFFDDSHKNIAAVKELKQLHPEVTIITRHIVHRSIASLHA